MVSVGFQGKPFNIRVIQVYTETTDAKKGEVDWFYAALQHLLERTPKRDVHIIIGDWNAKVGSQEIPGVTSKFSLGIQNKAGQKLTVLSRDHSGHCKHPFPTTQEKTVHMDINGQD